MEITSLLSYSALILSKGTTFIHCFDYVCVQRDQTSLVHLILSNKNTIICLGAAFEKQINKLSLKWAKFVPFIWSSNWTNHQNLFFLVEEMRIFLNLIKIMLFLLFHSNNQDLFIPSIGRNYVHSFKWNQIHLFKRNKLCSFELNQKAISFQTKKTCLV